MTADRRPPWVGGALTGAALGVALGGGWVVAQSFVTTYEDMLTPLVVLSFAGGFAGAWLGLGVVLALTLAGRWQAVRRSLPRDAVTAAGLGAAGCAGAWFLSWVTGFGTDPDAGGPPFAGAVAVGAAAGLVGAVVVRSGADPASRCQPAVSSAGVGTVILTAAPDCLACSTTVVTAEFRPPMASASTVPRRSCAWTDRARALPVASAFDTETSVGQPETTSGADSSAAARPAAAAARARATLRAAGLAFGASLPARNGFQT